MARRIRFQFERDLGRYRDRVTGRLVSDAQVRTAIEGVLRKDQIRMRELADAVRSGRMSREMWAVEFREMVTEVHLYSGAAARGGWRNMDSVAYGQIGAQVRAQLGFLAPFTQDVIAGRVTLDGAFTRRSLMYVQAGRTTFDLAQSAVKAAHGFEEESNVEDPAIPETSHCVGPNSCRAQTALGWVPIGTLVPIGQRACLSGCRCKKAFRQRPAA